MHWRSFVLWNALGGITWATVIGLIAYFLGHSAGGAIEAFGLFGLAAVLFAVVTGLYVHRRHRRATAAEGEGAGPTSRRAPDASDDQPA